MNQEYIKDLESEVVYSENNVKEAEVEVINAKEWLDKMKIRLAEDIIRLHNAKKA